MTALWVVLAALAGMGFALGLFVVAVAFLGGYAAFDDRAEDDLEQERWEKFQDSMRKDVQP